MPPFLFFLPRRVLIFHQSPFSLLPRSTKMATTTTYGTIPTVTTDPSEPWIQSNLGKRRPWKEMLIFSLPKTFNLALSRIKANAAYFHTNYAMIVLFVLFLSLLWRPLSLLVFVVLMFAWLFLYFLRDDPIVVLGYTVDERVVLASLSILTVVVLLTRATVNVVAGVSVGMLVVMLHAAFRLNDDLILDVEGSRNVRVDLGETASSSFSSSII